MGPKPRGLCGLKFRDDSQVHLTAERGQWQLLFGMCGHSGRLHLSPSEVYGFRVGAEFQGVSATVAAPT